MDAKKPILWCAALILASTISAFGLVGCLTGPGTKTSRPAGRTLYVSDSSYCAGRRLCFASIQEAVDAASEGDVVKVAQGTYTTTAPQVVAIEKGLQLVGGYQAGDWSLSRPDIQPAIIDAEGVLGRRGIFIDGRGVSTITVRGFRVRGGTAEAAGGGGIYVAGGSVVLEESVIEGCSADTQGGGAFIADGRVQLSSAILQGNKARYGGGLFIDGGSVVLDRDLFVDNEAPPMGGALAIGAGVVTGTNNLVVENVLAGTGVYLSGGHLTASHWTLVNNGRYGVLADLGIDIESGSITLQRSIVASHKGGLCGAGVIARQTLFHRVDHPCIAGASCVSNLFGDPKFVDPSGGDYHIAADSAAVDRGHSVDVFYDMDGDRRPIGPASDIGADEIGLRRAFVPLVVR